MNKREDILNACIMIEQLSEGSISKTDKTMKALDTEAWDCLEMSDWYVSKQPPLSSGLSTVGLRPCWISRSNQ